MNTGKLDIAFKIITVILLLLAGSLLSTCMPSEDNNSASKNKMSFHNDKLSFNRYLEYRQVDGPGLRVVNTVYENGAIEIYGDVVRVELTSHQEIYMIDEMQYDDENQLYSFFSNNAVIKLNVLDRTIEIHETEINRRVIYYINSTLKTNW